MPVAAVSALFPVICPCYDEKGRLIKIRNAKNQERLFQYDNNDRQVLVIDPLGNTLNISYDSNGNLTRKDMHELVIDPNTGNVLKEDVFSTLYDCDELDRIRSITDNLGNITRFFYDSRNSLIRHLDPLNNVKRISYDGRKIEQVMEMTVTGLGGGARLRDIQTKFEYDGNGNKITYTDANGNRTLQKYDQLDRKRLIIWNDSSIQKFEYDPDDNMLLQQDNNGLKHLYKFDALNHMFHMDLDFSELIPGITIDQTSNFEEYLYDGLGRVKLQRNDYCQSEIKSDSLSRTFEDITTFTTPLAPVTGSFYIQREFDELGNNSQITYPTGRKIRYHLDKLNRIRRIENVDNGLDYPGSGSLGNNYDVLINEYRGLRKSRMKFGNGASVYYSFDGNGQIIEIAHAATNTNDFLIIQQLYDGAGNMRFKNDIDRSGSNTEKYKYNSAYWLTKIEVGLMQPFVPSDFEPPSTVQPPDLLHGQDRIDSVIGSLNQDVLAPTYSYDQVGNRIQDTRPEEPAIYIINNLNEYTKIDQNTLRYDLNGNLLDDGRRRYFYDYRNYLTKVNDLATGQTITQFFYDVRGRRILNLTTDQPIQFLYDGQTLIEELQNGSVSAEYVSEYGYDEIFQVATKDENSLLGSEQWYHRDIVKSCRLLTDSTGQVSISYSYLPFGILKNPRLNRPHNPLLYMGRMFDGLTGLYDFRTRIYSPMLGRFLQRDVDSPDLYLFVGNNPLTFADPSGRERASAGRSELEITTYDITPKNLITKESVPKTTPTLDWETWQLLYDLYQMRKEKAFAEKQQHDLQVAAAMFQGSLDLAVKGFTMSAELGLTGGFLGWLSRIRYIGTGLRLYGSLGTGINIGRAIAGTDLTGTQKLSFEERILSGIMGALGALSLIGSWASGPRLPSSGGPPSGGALPPSGGTSPPSGGALPIDTSPHSSAQFERLKAELASQEIRGAPAVGSALTSGGSQHRVAPFYQNEAANGRVFTIKGDIDGLPRNLTQLEVPGGVVEWIVDIKGNLTHQRFIPGGIITGYANQHP